MTSICGIIDFTVLSGVIRHIFMRAGYDIFICSTDTR